MGIQGTVISKEKVPYPLVVNFGFSFQADKIDPSVRYLVSTPGSCSVNVSNSMVVVAGLYIPFALVEVDY